MSKGAASANFVFDKENYSYFCEGSWSVLHVQDLVPASWDKTLLPEAEKIIINGKGLEQFDSAGALALSHRLNYLKEAGITTELVDFNHKQTALLDLIQKNQDILNYQQPPVKKDRMLAALGKETIAKVHQADGFINLIGDLSSKFLSALGCWRQFHVSSIAANIYSAGIQALPIVALLSFLIGIVLAYQMGLQLQTYGANIFIAYLSGMAIFREFAPLITAIIVAGRTSSAFTAQIGSMQVNEEIDALKTMGLSPIELLVMPKVLGLLLVFPLLIFWADFFSILGALFMSKWMLNVGYYDFLARLKESVGLDQLLLGLYKAPAFALLIALVGCFQGFRVEADNIGSQTTKSVVQGLFLIIVADATFSILYSWLGL